MNVDRNLQHQYQIYQNQKVQDQLVSEINIKFSFFFCSMPNRTGLRTSFLSSLYCITYKITITIQRNIFLTVTFLLYFYILLLMRKKKETYVYSRHFNQEKNIYYPIVYREKKE